MEYKLKNDDVKKRYREYDISGDISVQNIEPLVSEMTENIKKCDSLKVNLNDITGFDIAALQFFYALKNSFIRDRKKLVVTCSMSEDVKKLLENCGVNDLATVLSIDRE